MNPYLNQEIKPAIAKKSTRYFAALIDYTFFIMILIVIGIYFGEKYTTESGGTGYHLEGFPALACMLVWFLIFPVLESSTGQTFGKALLKVSVVKQQDYSQVSFRSSLVRHLFDMVDGFLLGFIGVIVASNNDLKQRVGDLVAKTIVIKK